MSGYLIDWSKTPEITIVKKMCPLCKEPTGQDSKCYELIDKPELIEREDGSVQLQIRTMELEGVQEPIFSEQCHYRRYNSWFFNCNYPISQPMAIRLSSIEGIEKFIVTTAYRGEIIIADGFDVEQVLFIFKQVYIDFCKHKLEESIFLLQTDISELINEPNQTPSDQSGIQTTKQGLSETDRLHGERLDPGGNSETDDGN